MCRVKSHWYFRKLERIPFARNGFQHVCIHSSRKISILKKVGGLNLKTWNTILEAFVTYGKHIIFSFVLRWFGRDGTYEKLCVALVHPVVTPVCRKAYIHVCIFWLPAWVIFSQRKHCRQHVRVNRLKC